MKYLIMLLVVFCFTFNALGFPTREIINRIAPYPKFDVLKVTGRTQITYSNGDHNNPEFIIITCDNNKQEMNVVYYITHEGFQITDATYFTIQRYPRGWLKMTPPYHAPSVVIYDAGMSGEGRYLVTALEKLFEEGEWGIVITFETYVNDHDIITQAWSDIIPSRIIKRDITYSDLRVCEDTKFNSILPLIGYSNED